MRLDVKRLLGQMSFGETMKHVRTIVKLLSILGVGFLVVLASLAALYFYFDSDFYESRRFRSEIEENLDLQLFEVPEILDRENYGWAEEGGNRALLKLNELDCTDISKAMKRLKTGNGRAGYIEFFNKNNLNPRKLITWYKSNTHGDFTNYALDDEACILYRRYHYE